MSIKLGKQIIKVQEDVKKRPTQTIQTDTDSLMEKWFNKVSSLMDRKQKKYMDSNDFTQSMLLNLNCQLQDLQEVMVSMSKNVEVLNTRQMNLEKKYMEGRDEELRTTSYIPSNGTTLDEENVTGPITRSITMKTHDGRKARKVSLVHYLDNPDQCLKSGNRHKSGTGRTIIPWEELDPEPIVPEYSSEL